MTATFVAEPAWALLSPTHCQGARCQHRVTNVERFARDADQPRTVAFLCVDCVQTLGDRCRLLPLEAPRVFAAPYPEGQW